MQKTEVEAATAPLCFTASMEISQVIDTPFGGVGDCMDMMDMEMEPFGFIDILEEQNHADFFHPYSIFQHNNNLLQTENANANENEIPSLQQPAADAEEGVSREEGEMVIQHNHDDEMSNVFLEWLKSNKDKISTSDLRNVKLKKSMIESATKRLGGGKQGMKSLLKLILEWVQRSHLKNKNSPIGFGFEPPQSSSIPNCFNKPQLSPPPPPCIYATQPSSMVQYLPQLAENNPSPNSQLNVASHYNQPFGDNHFHPAVLMGISTLINCCMEMEVVVVVVMGGRD
ncbi:B3 domain-containing transcription factor [Stylosanthes scabra]|uniref:B3 domain-containing transcription factor n=1 Tax=Stylosanthes scabra TaxID=79078 RepID=A0ABU6UVB5_9FABA|nr:B3 domain-containing transcription factor [Stylosanthes scabra]